MSVIIRGIEMPKNCALCKFRGAGETWCPFTLRDVPGNTIPEDCPVGYVPPHGNLSEKHDIFKLISAFHEIYNLLTVEFMKALYNLPTIIEAEE